MRRARAGFAWVSMMDLLFGLFGALVILTVLLVLKLGQDSGVDQRPFHLITLELEPKIAGDTSASALPRMALGVEVINPRAKSCIFGASADAERCAALQSSDVPPDQPTTFRTSVTQSPADDPVLASVLFVGHGQSMTLSPFVSNTAALMDLPRSHWDSMLRLRVSVKTGATVWSPEPFCLSVKNLLDRADQDARGLARLNLCVLKRCSDGQTYEEKCKIRIQTGGQALVFE